MSGTPRNTPPARAAEYGVVAGAWSSIGEDVFVVGHGVHVVKRLAGPRPAVCIRRGAGRGQERRAVPQAPEPYPVFHVTAITHRKDGVYPATIVCIPPMEDIYIGGASVKLFRPCLVLVFVILGSVLELTPLQEVAEETEKHQKDETADVR